MTTIIYEGARREPHVVTEPVSVSVPTKRHGTLTFSGTLVVINDFTYLIELPEFPGETAGSESREEAIELLADRLIGILDKKPTVYWRRLGVIADPSKPASPR